jgi:hypothetical protein
LRGKSDAPLTVIGTGTGANKERLLEYLAEQWTNKQVRATAISSMSFHSLRLRFFSNSILDGTLPVWATTIDVQKES